MKRTDQSQSQSQPLSQEQPPRAKKYRARDFDGMSNSNMSGAGMSGMGSAAGASMGGSDIVYNANSGQNISHANDINVGFQNQVARQSKKQHSNINQGVIALESPNHPATTGGGSTSNSNLNRKNSRKMH
jgi:hypothetical protein